jgi:hypothetical protein
VNRLVSLAVLPDEGIDVLNHVVGIPLNREERIDLLFKVAPALVGASQSLRVVRREEGSPALASWYMYS